MANPLTGDFDAVVQVAVRQINGLLATLHQNGASTTPPLKLLHGVRARVGDVSRRDTEVAAFGDWALTFERARPAGPLGPLRAELVAGAPPGTARRLETAFATFGEVFELPPPDVVRGTATLQVSTVRISVAEGSTSEVIIHADVRGQYEPDSGTAALPATVNGEVRAVYEVQKIANGLRTRLLIRPSPHDQKIEFIPTPGSGLTDADALRIAAQVRKVLRESISLVPVDLPERFPFVDFKAVGSTANAAVALPLQRSNRPPPPGGIQEISQSFVGDSGFAFGVSEEYVRGLIDVDAIRARITQRTIGLDIDLPSLWTDVRVVTYGLRFSSGPTLTFQAGAIEIAGRVEVETTSLAPNGFVKFRQPVTLSVDVATQQVELITAGPPDVDESWFIPHNTAVNVVNAEIATALADNADAVRDVFESASTDLTTALRTFELSAAATYTQLEISPHGVIARGEISSAGRIAPVVRIGETDVGRALTAFQSWIPGGRIDRFVWSWLEYPADQPTVLSGVAKSATETNRFVLEKPPGITGTSQICLRVIGERLRPDGRTESVVDGSTCEIAEPVMGLPAPAWWEPVLVPLWMPDIPESARLSDNIAAHITVQNDRPQQAMTQNTIVFFADWRSSTPFDALVEALRRVRHQAALALFVIVPEGSFDSSRREFEARFRSFPAAISTRAQVAEDVDGGWSRTFDVGVMPALFMMNARGEFVWKAAGDLDPATLAAALDERIVPAPGLRFRPLRMHVRVGDRAPDVDFRDVRGDDGSLHRLFGHSLLFTFWQSSSTPCLTELRRLQALQNADPRRAPLIVAFHSGRQRQGLDDLCKEQGLSMRMVHDPEQRVARKFGVRCWPTTITIGGDGLIEHIQLGIPPDRGRNRDDRASGQPAP